MSYLAVSDDGCDSPLGQILPEDDDQTPDDHFHRELSELRRHLYSRAVSLTRDPSVAEDLVQETLVRALRARRRFQQGTNLAAWTSSIMRNLFIDSRRRTAVRMRWETTEETCQDEATVGPLDVLSQEDVEEALTQLPPAYRQIFELAYLENLSYREIADKLSVPMNTAGTRLLRAKLRVRKVLGEVFEQRYAEERDGRVPRSL